MGADLIAIKGRTTRSWHGSFHHIVFTAPGEHQFTADLNKLNEATAQNCDVSPQIGVRSPCR
jgi:hypothetical protein